MKEHISHDKNKNINENNINQNPKQPHVPIENMGKQWKKMFCSNVYDWVSNIKGMVCYCVSISVFCSGFPFLLDKKTKTKTLIHTSNMTKDTDTRKNNIKFSIPKPISPCQNTVFRHSFKFWSFVSVYVWT